MTTFRPLNLWFLNHCADKEELLYQMREMKRQGFGGFYMHWLVGGEPYLSDGWFRDLDLIIGEAEKLELEAWIYDEAWCPSCFAGGRILAKHPELQLQTIWHHIEDTNGGASVSIDFDLMDLLAVYAVPIEPDGPDMTAALRLDDEVGTVQLETGEPYVHDWGYYPHAKPQLHWRLTGDKTVWRFKWQPPDQRNWRIYIFCVRDMLRFEGLDRLDVLNPKAIEYFLRETHERYAARYRRYFGNVIPGVMTDEPKYWQFPWTKALPELFQSRFDMDLVPCLPALFDKTVPEFEKVRISYYRLVSDLFHQNYVRPMGEWCRENGLLLTGHISPEECPTEETQYTGSIARSLEYFDMPGTDLIIQAVGDEERPALNLGPRLASSVAHQQGKSRVFVEVGGCCPESVSLSELKYLCDWLMVNGINMITFHGLSYSLDGFRKYLTDQTLSVHNNLWPEIDCLTDYLARRCQLFSDYRPQPRVAVLKSHAAVRTSVGPGDEDKASALAADKPLIDLCWFLLTHHIDFDLLDGDTAGMWQSTASSLTFGHAAYDVVVIPDTGVIAVDEAEKLHQFRDQGGRVLALNRTPKVLNHVHAKMWNPGCTVVESMEAVADSINTALPRPFTVDADAGRLLSFVGYNGDHDALLMLLNLADTCQPCSVSFAGETVDVVLEPRESRLFSEKPIDEEAPMLAEDGTRLSLTGPWRVTAEKENHIPLIEEKTVIEATADFSDLAFILDESERDLFETLLIDGKEIPLDSMESDLFYDKHNVRLPLPALAKGEHTIEYRISRKEKLPTLLLAGQFSAFATENRPHVRLCPPVLACAACDRLQAGYPYVRGYLDFETRFQLAHDIEPGATLMLPGRKGAVAILIDGEKQGTVAWHPDGLTLKVGLAKGSHNVSLRVVGDSIGILRGKPCNAGVSGPPQLIF